MPVRLICVAPLGLYGLATPWIPGNAATLTSAAFTAGSTAADRIVAPCVAWNTTWSLSPDAAG